MNNFWKFLSFITLGLLGGYILKDNIGKPDEQNEIHIKQKGEGNVIDNIKTKFRERKRFRLRKKK